MPMLLHDFPNLHWLKKQIKEGFADQQDCNGKSLQSTRWPNVVLNVKSSAVYRDNIAGPLSLFSTISGNQEIKVDRKITTLNENTYCLSNAGQIYTLEINQTNSETFNVHFGENFTEDALRSILLTDEQLLDNNAPTPAYHFYSRTCFKDTSIHSIISKLRTTSDDMSQQYLMLLLLKHLIFQDSGLRKSERELPSIKASSRAEIMKRLFIAVDYIHSNSDSQISLDDLAKVSCLSKFHFLRLFKSAFKKTPHRFINEIRIEIAARKLKDPARNIKSIAREVGFKDSSSFSRLYFSLKGSYPTYSR